MVPLSNRYEIRFVIQAIDSNPNGEPQAQNAPRLDPYTGTGLITASSIKRHIRDYVQAVYAENHGMGVSVQVSPSDTNTPVIPYAETAADKAEDKAFAKRLKVKLPNQATYRSAISNFFDVRTFGSVLSSYAPKGGQVLGPVQVSMGRSIDPISPEQLTVSRVCVTKTVPGASCSQEYLDWENETPSSKLRTIGRKFIVPFGLYYVDMTVSANLAQRTGFSERDFEVLLEAIERMYDIIPTDTKQGISVVSPILIFKHGLPDVLRERDSILGRAPAQQLLRNVIEYRKKPNATYPRTYKDYDAIVKMDEIPDDVEIGFYSCGRTTWGKIPTGCWYHDANE